MPIKKRSLRSMLQDANRASLDVPAPVPTPEADLHSPDPSSGEVFQYGAKKDPAADLVNFEWPGHAPQGSADDTPTQVFTDADMARVAPKPVRRRLTDKEARMQAERAERGLRGAAEDARPAKPLAQELAEIKPDLPMGPLEGQGAMEGKPVESIIDRRGANMGRIAGERRAASGNMVSATPSNADIGDAVVKTENLSPEAFDVMHIQKQMDSYGDLGRMMAGMKRDGAPTLEEMAVAANRDNDLAAIKTNPTTQTGMMSRVRQPYMEREAGRDIARIARETYQSTEPSLRDQAGAIARSNTRNVEASMLGERVNPQPPTTRVRPSSATAVTTPPPVENAVGTAGSPSRFNLVGQFRKGAEGGASGSALEATGGAIGRTLGEVAGAYRAGQYGKAAFTAADAGVDAALAPFKYAFSPAISAAKGIMSRNAATSKALEAVEGSPFLKRMAQKSWIRGGQAIGNTAEAVGMGGFGTALKLGRIGTEAAAISYVGRKGAESTEARQGVAPAFREALAEQQRNANKYGMDVSSVRSNSSNAMLQLKALVGADPKIEVKENPSLREQYDVANRKRIRHLISTGSITPIAHGRPYLKGNGNE